MLVVAAWNLVVWAVHVWAGFEGGGCCHAIPVGIGDAALVRHTLSLLLAAATQAHSYCMPLPCLQDSGFRFVFDPIRCKFKPTEQTLQVCEESGIDLAQEIRRAIRRRERVAADKLSGGCRLAAVVTGEVRRSTAGGHRHKVEPACIPRGGFRDGCRDLSTK